MTSTTDAEKLAEEVTGCLLGGRHVVLAGRPSSGKTRLAGLVAKKALAARASVVVHSLELSTATWLHTTGTLPYPNRLHVNDDPSAGLADLSGEMPTHSPGILVVDYVQLMKMCRSAAAVDAPSPLYGELEKVAGPASLLCLSQVRRQAESGPWTGADLVWLTGPPESWLVRSTQGLRF